jgi:hypothetical protein
MSTKEKKIESLIQLTKDLEKRIAENTRQTPAPPIKIKLKKK